MSTNAETSVPETLSDFLKSRVSLLNSTLAEASTTPSRVTAVIGNTSGDIDSIASAIGGSWLLSASGELTIPLLNFKSEDLRSRIQLVAWLKDGLSIEDAEREVIMKHLKTLTIDTDDVTELLNRESLSVCLVDHNVPAPAQRKLIPRVTRIYDHHRDETEKVFSGCSLNANEVHLGVGSCATIIAEKWLSSPDQRLMPKEVALLLLGPILTDSNVFDESLRGGRWNYRDEIARDTLLSIAGKPSTTDWWKKAGVMLQNAKFDPANVIPLGFATIFRGDCKSFQYGDTMVGFASITLRLETLLDHMSVHEILNEVRQNLKAYDLLVLTSHNVCLSTHKEKRQLGLFWSSTSKYSSKFESLTKPGGPLEEMQLQELKDVVKQLQSSTEDATLNIYLWEQGLLSATRKKIEPIIASHLSS